MKLITPIRPKGVSSYKCFRLDEIRIFLKFSFSVKYRIDTEVIIKKILPEKQASLLEITPIPWLK